MVTRWVVLWQQLLAVVYKIKLMRYSPTDHQEQGLRNLLNLSKHLILGTSTITILLLVYLSLCWDTDTTLNQDTSITTEILEPVQNGNVLRISGVDVGER